MNDLKINRRNFLKTGAALTGLAGLGLATASNVGPLAKVANAATGATAATYTGDTKQWSVLRPKADYGGARIKYVGVDENWLGTTQIVGDVKRSSGTDNQIMGFFMKNGPKMATGEVIITKNIEPMGTAIEDGLSEMYGREDIVWKETKAARLPLPDPEQTSMHIKDFCYFMRADEVGIGPIPDYFYWTDVNGPFGGDAPKQGPDPWINEGFEHAVVIGIDRDKETFWASSGYGAMAEAQSMKAYYFAASTAIALANYIRSLGYKARAMNASNYIGTMPILLAAAGIGEIGRNANAVTHPRLGYRPKWSAVLTDLPLADDKPIDFGYKDFCRVCKKCATECPAQAITEDTDESEYNGYMRWNAQLDKCAEFVLTNPNGSWCGRCIKVCPWSSKEDSWFHKAGIFVGSSGEMPSKFLKSIDDLFGYGTEILPQYKWWIEWPELWPSGKLAE